jgi:hypothetical protein
LRFEQLRGAELGASKMDVRIAAVTLEAGGTVVTPRTTMAKKIAIVLSRLLAQDDTPAHIPNRANLADR